MLFSTTTSKKVLIVQTKAITKILANGNCRNNNGYKKDIIAAIKITYCVINLKERK